MAHDFENIDDIDDLSDQELRRLVRERLGGHRALDLGDITVHVRDGIVALGGRVGTEGERRVAERVVTDLIGIDRMRNDILIDPLRRAESPEAVDDHLVDENEHEGVLLGDRPLPLSTEAEHLTEDLDSPLFGTTDVGKAIQRGTAWIPPTSPTQEGMAGEEASPPDYSEDH